MLTVIGADAECTIQNSARSYIQFYPTEFEFWQRKSGQDQHPEF